MEQRLAGKTAIVTGGGSGIGEAISKKFAREGARVVVAGLPEDPVEEVAGEIREDGGTAISFEGDVSHLETARQCVQQAVDEYGQLDILINNAGVFVETNELTDYSEEAFDYMIKHNNKTTFMMSKAALPELQKTGGNIVSAGSEAGMVGIPENVPYGGTKAFNMAFMEGLAGEQARHGVRCNSVAPGPIDTAWTHSDMGPMTEKMEETNSQANFTGRRGTPEEVANVYLFLASDEASYVTGATYKVDGGITIAKGAVGDQADDSLKQQPEGETDLHHAKDGHTSIRRDREAQPDGDHPNASTTRGSRLRPK